MPASDCVPALEPDADASPCTDQRLRPACQGAAQPSDTRQQSRVTCVLGRSARRQRHRVVQGRQPGRPQRCGGAPGGASRGALRAAQRGIPGRHAPGLEPGHRPDQLCVQLRWPCRPLAQPAHPSASGCTCAAGDMWPSSVSAGMRLQCQAEHALHDSQSCALLAPPRAGHTP